MCSDDSQYEIGMIYPTIKNKKESSMHEGSIYKALDSENHQYIHTFAIVLLDVTEDEIRRFNTDEIHLGIFTEKEELMVLMFDIGDSRDFITEAPFNIKAIPQDKLCMPKVVDLSHEISINLHLIEASTGILTAKRTLVMPPELALTFFERVHSQFQSKAESFNSEYEHFSRFPPECSIQQIHRFPLKNKSSSTM